MPITFHPSPEVEPELYQDALLQGCDGTATSMLKGALPLGLATVVDEMLQSSFPLSPPSSFYSLSTPFRVASRSNGFVETVVDAYNNHHPLVIRPDDVWLCILSQFNLFVNRRAESLRGKFVAHKDKQELKIITVDTRHNVDFGVLATQMTNLMQTSIVDSGLQRWILPNFTTTTENDVIAASVTMMATLKHYFNYTFRLLRCGLPVVTLAGERQDWESILHRIEKLKEYGHDAMRWYDMLKPVLTRFVRAFEDDFAESVENKHFWQRVTHTSRNGSGAARLDGWITAFCVFDKDGHWMVGKASDLRGQKEDKDRDSGDHREWQPLVLDGIPYGYISLNKLPPSWAEVDVRLIDDTETFDSVMVAGVIGTSVERTKVVGTECDRVSPIVGWWIFTKKAGDKHESAPEIESKPSQHTPYLLQHLPALAMLIPTPSMRS